MQKVAKESFMSWNRIEEIILDVKPLFDAASDAICIQNVEEKSYTEILTTKR